MNPFMAEAVKKNILSTVGRKIESRSRSLQQERFKSMR